MKNAILIHGTGGTPESFWFPYVSNLLQSDGYSVWEPLVPSSERPELSISVPFFLEQGIFNQKTVIVAHSSGCPTVLSLLEKIETEIAKVILVAGFYQSIDSEGTSDRMLQTQYNWGKIKSTAREIVLINSDNDPWGCDDIQARPVAQKLEAMLIVLVGQGHMGSEKFIQPYRTFPLLAKLLNLPS